MDSTRQEHTEAGVGLCNTEERSWQNREAKRCRVRLLDVAFDFLVNAVEIFVVVENFESLFLEILVAKPDRRDKAGGLAAAVCLPEGEAALEERLRESFVKACLQCYGSAKGLRGGVHRGA